MIKSFPPLNGPLASADVDDPRVTDYSLGRSVIYAGFSWSEAEAAYKRTHELAAKYGLGFFDLTDLGTLWWPHAGGRLNRADD